ncbi:hypothetical protein [Neptunicoccus cionae]|uniref:Uncharacterized protein n=1 Tax=Neptunicoccus cionae TaxID=2035344 RepID=A0A916R4L1_9RHOB|nr:hypothetical protein [Amylibacter cionae]GGA30590.1 hypothetical protein GCM10011498_34740 [Amylibacter cionae]
MELRILYGAHQTAQEQLRAHLEHNSDLLAGQGIYMPAADTAEVAMNTAIKALRKGNADEETAQTLMQELSGGKPWKRILVIRPAISGSWMRPTKEGTLYPRGSSTAVQLNRLVGEDRVHLYFATRNPASFLPACYNLVVQSKPDQSFQDFAYQSDPSDLRWSEYLHRVQGKESEQPITVWSYEDFPYIWRSIAQAFSGVANKEDLVAAQGDAQPEMSLKGAMLMQAYLAEHPTTDEPKLRKLAQKFEEKFPAKPNDSVPEVWPSELVEALSDAYDDDNYYIDRMENIQTIRRPVYPEML